MFERSFRSARNQVSGGGYGSMGRAFARMVDRTEIYALSLWRL